MRKYLVLLFLLAAVPAFAQSADNPKQYPLFSLARLHAGVRTEYEWGSKSPDLQTATLKEFRVGVSGAYSLVPHLAAIGRVTAGLGGAPRFAVGLNLELFNGAEYAAKKGI